MGREPGGAAGPAAAFPCTWTPIKRPPAKRGDVSPRAAAVGDCFQREFSPLSVFSSHVLKRSLHKSEENCGHPVTDGHRSRGATLQCPAANCHPPPHQSPAPDAQHGRRRTPGGTPSGQCGRPCVCPLLRPHFSEGGHTARGVSASAFPVWRPLHQPPRRGPGAPRPAPAPEARGALASSPV